MGIIQSTANALQTIRAAFRGELIRNNAELQAAKDAGWLNRPTLGGRYIEKTQLPKEEYYKGIIYRALTTISNRTAQIIMDNTRLKDKNGEEIEINLHPYWAAIDSSPHFTNFELFFALSTYLQLGGFAPVLAVRNFSGEGNKISSVGEVKEFKIISPYNLKLLLDEETGQVIGYEETLNLPNGKTKKRKLGLPEIIPIKTFNPFNNILGYGSVQAANDTQFTIKEAGKYTRRSMKNNITASGILTVNQSTLTQAQKDEFVAEVKARFASDTADGAPVVAFGSSALEWADIRQDLDKMALEKIHNINRDDLMVIMGVSKTILGIEESGTTRETARVQRDLLLENICIPLVRLILDEFNQDFRNNYPVQWKTKGWEFEIESPLSKDYDSEKAKQDVLSTKMDIAKKMWEMGATRQSIIDALNLPQNLQFDREPAWAGTDNPNDLLLGINPTSEPTQQKIEPLSKDLIPDAKNALTGEQFRKLRELRDQLIADVSDNELELVDSYIEEVEKATTNDISSKDRKAYIKKLEKILKEYYLAVVPLLGSAMIDFRNKQYGLQSEFALNNKIKGLISQRVSLTAFSHFDTVDKSLTNLIKEGLDAGWSRDRLVREIRSKFTNEISVGSARRLAVTETNNAFNKSQFWADQIFLKDNKLEKRAYKQLVTYGPNPCAFCEALASEAPIPFDQPFLAVGQTLEAEFDTKEGKVIRSMTPNEDFGDIEDGNVHPGCQCRYRLIIRAE